jgi:hypothetical protein
LPSNDLQADEKIEEVNFEDMGRVLALIEDESNAEAQQSRVVEVEKKLTDFHLDSQPSIHAQDKNFSSTNGDANALSHDSRVKSSVVVDDVLLSMSDEPRKHSIPESNLPEDKSSTPTDEIVLTVKDVSSAEQMAMIAQVPTKPTLILSKEEREDPPINPVQEQDSDVSHAESVLRKSLSDIMTNDANIVRKLPEEQPILFHVDTQPTHHGPKGTISFDSIDSGVPLGVEPNDEDDIIVYEAPNPRSTRATPAFQASALPKTPVTSTDTLFASPSKASVQRKSNPLRRGTLFERVSRKGKGKAVRKRLSSHASFGAFGAMVAEARLHQNDEDPRKDERRHRDSDVDWGDDDDDEDEMDPRAVAEGMDLDPDLIGAGVSMNTMRRFVDGVSGEGSKFVTMDDLKDIQGMKYEEESNADDVEDDTIDDLIVEEEMVLADESNSVDEEDEEDEDYSDDEQYSPRTGFQARLDKLRRQQETEVDDIDTESEDVPDFKWPKKSGEEYIEEVQVTYPYLIRKVF